MSSTATLTRPTGKRYALADYDAGRRVLVIQRTDETTVQLTDVPLTAAGRPFLVEQFDLDKLSRDLDLPPHAVPQAALHEMTAIAEVYIAHAAELGRCPLAS
jgi:hypothetical protein